MLSVECCNSSISMINKLYARWGGLELAEMHLPIKEVTDDFYHGNFVVNVLDQQLNQIDHDHHQKW